MTTPESYAEPDKLGELPSDDSLRTRVVRAAAGALGEARAAAAAAEADPHGAVHVVRKALRQLRAMVELVGPALPKRERNDLARGFAAARRSLGPARDQEVARDLLGTLAPIHELGDAAAAIDAAAAPDRVAAEAMVADVRRAVTEAATHVDALTAALPDDLRPRDVARGLAQTYKRARRARRRAKHSERAVHRWRRRAKELSYQLVIVDVLPGTAELREALRGLDNHLSAAVDHLMAKDYVRLYGGDAADALALQGAVHDGLLAGTDVARSASRGLFKMRPKRLRRQLVSALAGAAAAANTADHDPGDHDPGDRESGAIA